MSFDDSEILRIKFLKPYKTVSLMPWCPFVNTLNRAISVWLRPLVDSFTLFAKFYLKVRYTDESQRNHQNARK